jgi:hypothetical protein
MSFLGQCGLCQMLRWGEGFRIVDDETGFEG